MTKWTQHDERNIMRQEHAVGLTMTFTALLRPSQVRCQLYSQLQEWNCEKVVSTIETHQTLKVGIMRLEKKRKTNSW